MAASSVTGVGKGSEHGYLGVTRLIGPRWTQQHEDTWLKLTNQVLQHSKVLSVLIWAQVGILLILGAAVGFYLCG